MTAPELDKDDYDVVVLGTGLAESIAAAALAKVGKSVLHLDPNEYYGSDQASLTLDELIVWSESHQSSSKPNSATSHPGYTQSSTTGLPSSLSSDRRRYALSLFPSILPSRGPLISTLIDSDVSKYVSFRLLDGVSVWRNENKNESEGGIGFIKRVPGSKEEIFKDKSISLLEKRKLMKFLMFATGDFENDVLFKGKEQVPLLELLETTFQIPSHLSTSITYAIAHCSSSTDPSLPSLIRARRYLRSSGRYGSSPFLVGQYGGAGEISQGFCRACAVYGGTYVLGPSAVIESVQVGAGNDEVSEIGQDSGIVLKIPCHPRQIRAKHLISNQHHILGTSLESSSSSILQGDDDTSSKEIITTANCIAIVTSIPIALKRTRISDSSNPAGQQGEAEEFGQSPLNSSEEDDEVSDDDTAVIVFPPEGDRPLVRALIMGEGTGSCPSGQYIIYLTAITTTTTTTIERLTEPSTLLKPILHLLHPNPAFEAYYLSHRSFSTSRLTTSLNISGGIDKQHPPPCPAAKGPLVLLEPYGGEVMMTEGLDWEAEQGRRAFWAVMGGEPGGFEEGEEGRVEQGKGFFEKAGDAEVEDEL